MQADFNVIQSLARLLTARTMRETLLYKIMANKIYRFLSRVLFALVVFGASSSALKVILPFWHSTVLGAALSVYASLHYVPYDL